MLCATHYSPKKFQITAQIGVLSNFDLVTLDFVTVSLNPTLLFDKIEVFSQGLKFQNLDLVKVFLVIFLLKYIFLIFSPKVGWDFPPLTWRVKNNGKIGRKHSAHCRVIVESQVP